jgi:hypothetical protein
LGGGGGGGEKTEGDLTFSKVYNPFLLITFCAGIFLQLFQQF